MKKLITHYSLLITSLALLFLFSGVLLWFNPAQAQTDPTELPLYALPDARIRVFTSGGMALSADNQTVLVVNTFNNTLSITQPRLRRLLTEIPVGHDPRTVAFTDDSQRAVITNRGDGTLSVLDVNAQTITATFPVGVLPYGVVMADNQTAYVSLQGESAIAIVDINSGTVRERITVPGLPSGLALWGDFLYVTHFWSGQVSLVYLPQRIVVRTISTGLDTGLSQSISIDNNRGMAYVPQTRSNAQNPALTFDTTVFPVVNVLNLNALNVERGARITLDTADRPVNMPFEAVLDRFRQVLYVINAGSDDVSVIDLTSNTALAHLRVGSNPRAGVLNNEGTSLYVYNALDGSISTIDTETLTVTGVLPISTATLSADVTLGAQLFYNARDPRLSANRWISCANCHFDGLSDGRVWAGFGDGGRNTPLLYDLLGTPPYNWSATWDEVADVEVKIRDLQAGFGLITGETSPAQGASHAGQSLDLDSLTQYLLSLQAPASPLPADAALVERGAQVFTEQGCDQCHVGAVGTNLQMVDVGTGGTFDTPSLRWLWLSAPYFHDGRATTLRDVFSLPGDHQLIYEVPVEDLNALMAYLLSLPQAQ
ncbi:MAG: cytochrome c peroxidase [Anaerolineae bacterium]